MSGIPPSIPPRPNSSAATNPNEVWGNSALPPRPASVAGLVRSTGSSLRRAQAQEEAERAAEIRRAAFEANEARIKQELAEELDVADEESLAQGPKVEGTVNPPPPGVDGETVVLERQLQELRDREATLERILLSRRTPGVTLPIVSPSSYKQLVPPTSDVVDIAFRKVSAPKAWTGEFNHRRREAWIKTALGYLSSIGIPPSLKLVEAKQPGVFYHLRSLFSSESKVNSLSPQDWFDGVQRRSPLPTVQTIFDSMRTHWVEDGAADLALSKYRKAVQGSLKVRDFGAYVKVLANDIFDRQVTDEDKKATFLEGLSTSARNFVRQVQATQAATFGSERKLDFDGMVRLAARFDTLESKSSFNPPSSSSTGSEKRRTGANSSTENSSSKPSSSKTGDTDPPKSWVDNATTWQSRFPIKDKAPWYKKDAKDLPSAVKCYNCSCMGLHPSSGCPNPRVDPRPIFIASVSARASPPPPSTPPPIPEVPDESEAEGISSPLAGKAHGE
ncbi:hypothetical protein JCM11641_001080 [Rhodosporidiobolus odoratus]